MLRIGGKVCGWIVAATEVPAVMIEWKSRIVQLAPDLWFVTMSAEIAQALDRADGRDPGPPMIGFDLLSAGAISFAEQTSTLVALAYFERSYGLELVDCAVAWDGGRVSAGPTGSSATGNDERTALNVVLDALGVSPGDQPALMTRLSDI
jgi:hypothetical protein